MPALYCPACRRESLVIKQPVYEGFTRTGENMTCAVCGHVFPPEQPAAAPPPARKIPALFADEDLPRRPSIFTEGENRTICRYCLNYLVNPFKQWCGLHHRDVEATDHCDKFAPRPPEKVPEL